MFYYLYKITNLVNGKIYVGVHKAKSMDDGYMGSGKVIKSAIEKYGLENFRKDILETFENAEAMYAREKEVVNDDFLRRKDIYNLRRGGDGGFDYINKNEELRIEKNRKARRIANEQIERIYGDDWRSVIAKLGAVAANTPEVNAKRQQTRKERGIKSDASYMHTDVARAKHRESLKRIEHQQGEKNSQYGMVWVSNIMDKTSYKVKKELLFDELKKDNVVVGRIVDWAKYFGNIEETILKEQKKNEVVLERKQLADKFRNIQRENNIDSVRELHKFLVMNELFDKTAETLRLFLNKY